MTRIFYRVISVSDKFRKLQNLNFVKIKTKRNNKKRIIVTKCLVVTRNVHTRFLEDKSTDQGTSFVTDTNLNKFRPSGDRLPVK